MTTLDEVILTLDRIGVAEIVLPFLLVFTIVYAVLKKTHILGESNDKFNVILALVMALAVIFPHVTGRGPDVVPIINNALPNVAVVAIAIIMLLFMIGIWGEEWSFAGKPIATWIIILAVGTIVYIFGTAAGWWSRNLPRSMGFLMNRDTQVLLITLLVFGIIVAYITKDPEEDENKRFINRLDKGIGGIFDPKNRGKH